jgi:hypothetical protein
VEMLVRNLRYGNIKRGRSVAVWEFNAFQKLVWATNFLRCRLYAPACPMLFVPCALQEIDKLRVRPAIGIGKASTIFHVRRRFWRQIPNLRRPITRVDKGRLPIKRIALGDGQTSPAKAAVSSL